MSGNASGVEVRASPIEGVGIFATRHFAAGERVRKRNIARDVTDDHPIRASTFLDPVPYPRTRPNSPFR